MTSTKIHPASFRDPSGYIFKADDGILYRQVNRIFQEDFDEFKSCGLYNDLVTNKILISHQQINENLTGSEDYYTTLKPILIPFISYPYEWSFDMLKEAALLTLKAAKVAMKYNMMLKDASGYNVQWFDGKMIFIDTLSFEKWDATKPWVAYRQFCEHFLAPLALMHYLKIPLQKLLLSYPDGIPLSLVKKLLPFRSRFNLNTYLHLHLHAAYSLKPSTQSNKTIVFSKTKQENLLQSLEQSIQSFSLNAISGVWSGYYNEARAREDYLIEKKKIIQSWLSSLSINSAIDIGANEGEFSLLLAGNNIPTISVDFDHYSINQLYRKIKENSVVNCTPLIIDFSNPSPAIGLNSEEHSSFLERIKVDLVLALAVVHHLAIGKNIPFEKIAKILSTMGKYLIIEFVPKEDEKIELMVNSGAHIFHEYNEDKFLSSFGDYFSILKKEYISDTKRTIYLMRKHEL